MSREEKPSIRERLTQAKEQAAEKVEHRTIDREKMCIRDRLHGVRMDIALNVQNDFFHHSSPPSKSTILILHYLLY